MIDIEALKKALEAGGYIACPTSLMPGPPLQIEALDLSQCQRAPKCECGSDKAKLPFHSSWCPKVTK
jgi:hypothetical protein